MSEKNGQFFRAKNIIRSVNYLYFGLYFFLFAALQITFVYLMAPPFQGSLTYVYMLHAALQSFVEVLIMAGISGYLLAYKHRRIHTIYIAFTVLILLARGIDFILVRLMDLSVWYGMSLFIQESFTNFVETLHSSSISLTVWVLGLGALIGMFIIGVGLFTLLEKVSRKRPLRISCNYAFIALFISCFGLLGSDMYVHTEEGIVSMKGYHKGLPWKRTFIPFTENRLTLEGALTSRYGKNPWQETDSSAFLLKRKPDLFLFITESLRYDFLTEETTPTLASFRREYTEFPRVFSPANATQISWFSTFYSLYPFYWSQYKEGEVKEGSHGIAFLKKLGYEIHVYSASGLKYYSMDEVLFGKDGYLVDTLEQVRKDPSMTPWEADQAVIQRVCDQVSSSEKTGGRAFILFLDSTHFDYSWPEEKTKFFPIHEKMNYIKLACKRTNLDKVKNRYKNSLYFVDELFSKFQNTLKEKGVWDQSVVIFTADHGEEFDEEGNVFHASNLSWPQIQVPLYIKLAKETDGWQLNKEAGASQIDIFPTLVHYLTEEIPGEKIFQGKSLFLERESRTLIGGRYSASRPPGQFYMQNGPYRIVLDFCNNRDIFHCNELRIDALYNEKGEEVLYSPSLIDEYFQKPLQELFSLDP